MSKKGSNLNSS